MNFASMGRIHLDRGCGAPAVLIFSHEQGPMSAKTLCAGVFLVAAGACAKHNVPAGTASMDAAPVSQSSARNRDVITHDELQAPGVVGMNVLEVVRALRPRFLTVRGLNTLPTKDVNGNPFSDDESGKVHSSIDGTKVGPLDQLTTIRASTIKEIRYLDVPAAHQKFGSASREGPVILVVTM
jgi:hypothetical protein